MDSCTLRLEGNELADETAKKWSSNNCATCVKFPISRCVCYTALRSKTKENWIKSYKQGPLRAFNMLWKDTFTSKELVKMNRRDLPIASQILTGHAAINYHLSKLNFTINSTCPLYEAEDETVSHFLGQCPMLEKLRAELLDTYYTTASDIVDRHSLRQVINYANRTKRLELITS